MTTDSSTGDWTPERAALVRTLYEKAIPAWQGGAFGMMASVAVTHLPAALDEIERLTAELAARAPAARVTGVRVATGAREELNEFAEQAWRDGLDVEAFTDIREERAPGARSAPFVPTEEQAHHSALLAALYAKGATEREVIDFLYRESEERRAALLKSAEREWPPHVVLPASRPDAPERTFPRVTLGSVAPGSLIENAGGFIALVLAQEGRKHRRLLWVDTGMIGDMHEGATVSLRATPAELDALTSADASRPGLTEEQAPTPAEMLAACTEEGFGGFGQGFVTGVLAERARLRWLPVVTENQPYIADGKTGNPTEEPCDPESCHGCANEALLRASRGETGPAPSKPAKESDDAPDSGHDDTALTAEQYDRHKARIASGEIPGGAPTTHTVDFGCARPTHAGPEATCSLCHPAPEAP